jgi:hypothetical protein
MIPQLTTDVTSILAENADAVWAWSSATLYDRLRSQNPDHLLVRVWDRFDLRQVEQACADYRHYQGERGQCETHPIPHLCRALLVKHLHSWSLRQTCREIQTNSLVRGFVGYRLDQETLGKDTLNRFEQWVNRHHPRLFFNTILAQIDEDFPEEVTQPQIGDTFALHSLAAPQSRTQLLRSSAARLLKAWNALAPSLLLPGLTPDLTQALWGQEHEPKEHWLDPAQRDERERQTACAAHTFLALVRQALPLLPPGPSLLHLALDRWLALLHKALSDEFVLTPDASDQLTARHATGKERGSFVLGSSVDPEATFRKHGEQNDLGYNIHVSATKHFVREIFATTGAAPDGSGVASLIANQREQGWSLPPKFIYDRAAGSPKIFHDVAQASDGQTQLVAALIDHSKRSNRFGPLDFTLNQDGSLTCPAGQSTTTCYRSNAADGWTYRFSAKQCHDCPLWEACRGPRTEQTPTPETVPLEASQAEKPAPKRKGPGPKAHRQVFISSYRSMQRAAILYTQSDAFKLDMKLRPLIEGTIAALVRYNGARRAKGIGLTNADCQARGAALAFNLKRWRTLTLAREKAQRLRPDREPGWQPEEIFDG